MSDEDIYERFAERAAICEYEGGVSRDHAEFIALREIRKLLGEVPKWLLERIAKDKASD